MRVLLFLTLLIPPPCAAAAGAEDRERELAAFIDEMSSKHGFDPGALRSAFGKVRSRPEILALMSRAAEPKPWEDYRGIFVTNEKVEAGLRFWRENVPTLQKAGEKYGVPAEVVIAILGVETHYGRQVGRHRVLEALATLAFEYPPRAAMFRSELEHFLLLAREESLPLDAPVGSYAGAMGIAQFMPGSYRRYAVDFDGDGHRDLFRNYSDAIGSVANYLTAHGWQRNGPVASPAEVAETGLPTFDSPRLSERYSLEELKSLGVTAPGAHPVNRRAIPLTLKTRAGSEYWLGFENFYVLTRYNHSVYYAMAVFQLGEEVRKRLHAPGVADQP